MPRIDRLLARNLGLSRRDVTRGFRQHAVQDAEGRPLTEPAWNLPPSQLPFAIRWYDEPHVLYHDFAVLQHKPLGVVTAMRDAKHRTAYDVLPRDLPLRRDLRAVGRLDRDTSGLLLWTTDGELLHRITHPRYAIPRRYHAALRTAFSDSPPDLVLDDGHRPDIRELTRTTADAMHPALARPPAATHYATITVTSGRFHEVRRIFAALGSHVEALCRVAFGPLELPPDLAPEGCLPLDLKAVFRGIHPVLPAPSDGAGPLDGDEAAPEPVDPQAINPQGRSRCTATPP